MALVIGVVKASLPSYFPQRHHVFEDVLSALADMASEISARVVEAPGIPMNAEEAQRAVDHCRSEGADFLLLVHGGFAMGDVARQIAASDLPMGVWATPEPSHEGDIQLNNFVSLNMTMSIARGVRDLARFPLQWYFGAPEATEVRSRILRTLRALSALRALQSARIGVIGGLAPTFYNMEVSGSGLKDALGVEICHVDMSRLTEAMAVCEDDVVAAELAEMSSKAVVRGVSDHQMSLTARAVLALRSITETEGFTGLAVSDWPALQENPGMHPGAAFSWLEEADNMAIASEGDVLGAVTQIVARSLTGRVGSLLDMTSPQLEDDRILMWHGGGGPLYMAKGQAAWINHPMIGRGTPQGACFGAIADFEFADGPCTILRVARSGSAGFSVEGEVRAQGESGFTGTRGWVTFFASKAGNHTATDIVTTVMEHGLEHHFILVPGRRAADFNEFASWSGMSTLRVIPAHDGLPENDRVSVDIRNMT